MISALLVDGTEVLKQTLRSWTDRQNNVELLVSHLSKVLSAQVSAKSCSGTSHSGQSADVSRPVRSQKQLLEATPEVTSRVIDDGNYGMKKTGNFLQVR
jgi:hypothetical protein